MPAVSCARRPIAQQSLREFRFQQLRRRTRIAIVAINRADGLDACRSEAYCRRLLSLRVRKRLLYSIGLSVARSRERRCTREVQFVCCVCLCAQAAVATDSPCDPVVELGRGSTAPFVRSRLFAEATPIALYIAGNTAGGEVMNNIACGTVSAGTPTDSSRSSRPSARQPRHLGVRAHPQPSESKSPDELIMLGGDLLGDLTRFACSSRWSFRSPPRRCRSSIRRCKASISATSRSVRSAAHQRRWPEIFSGQRRADRENRSAAARSSKRTGSP